MDKKSEAINCRTCVHCLKITWGDTKSERKTDTAVCLLQGGAAIPPYMVCSTTIILQCSHYSKRKSGVSFITGDIPFSP